MYLLMDLVVNHCSDEHEWFRKACEDPDGKYGHYFYLRDKKEGELPTNWRSYFGGPVWDDLPGTDKQYLHMFHKKQPDLNWENPRVRQEIYKMINFWLEKGVAGFRLDAIINIKKALPVKDYPADRPDGLADASVMLAHAEGIGAFLKEMKEETFKKHHAFTVGEVFNDKPEELAAFIGDEGYFSSMFDFNAAVFGSSENGWHDAAPITPDDYKKCCFASQAKAAGINIEVEQVDSAAWSDMKKNGGVDCSISNWYVDYSDPESMLYPMTKTDTNSSFWHNAEFDQLLEDGIATTDSAERQEIYKKAEHIMTREDWATTPIYNETKFYLLNPSITGFEIDATFRMFWKDADIQ